MRVTFGIEFRDGTADIALAAERLAAAQRQVSSGHRINDLSDDPVGASSVVQQQSAIARIDAYTAASDSASSRLTVADSVLSDLIDTITAAQTTVVGAQGSEVTATQADAAVQQLGALRDAVLSDMNTQVNGTFLFGGTNVLAQPYVQLAGGAVSAYQGNAATASVGVDASRSVPISFDGGQILQGADPADLFSTFASLATAITNRDSVGMSQGLAALKRAFDRATVAQTAVGNALNTIDSATTQRVTARNDAAARLSKVQDADMASAITEMTSAQNAYSAALGAFATVNKLSLMDYLK
jgi:flagellar hook-associated protein 3 FlgL